MLLATLATFMFVLQTLFLKQFKLPEQSPNKAMFSLSASYSALIAFGLLIGWVLQGTPVLSLSTWLLGGLFGLTFTLTMFFYTCAMNTGPLSYSSFYYSASLLVPVVASIFVWGEHASIYKLCGIALFLLSFYCIQVWGGQKNQKGSIRWMIYCLLAFLTNGILPVLSKWHQTIMQGSETNELMLVGFASAMIFSIAGATWFGTFKEKEPRKKTQWTVASLIIVIGLAVSTGVGNAMMTYLSGRVPGAFLYPFVNGSMIVLLTLVSALLFKEKLSKGGIMGILTGIIAIILVNV